MNSNLNNDFERMNMKNNSTTYVASSMTTAPTVERVLLPTKIIEKPVAVHEEIRQELVEEIQPIVEIEKLKTEIHQVTQPLFDKEIKPVNLQSKTLATEILPEMNIASRGVRMTDDVSSVAYANASAVVIEKPAIFQEVDKTQIIEEIQPVVYKETIVPHVIQETKPIYQKIVEGPTYTQETLPPRDISGMTRSMATKPVPVVAVIEEPVIIERVTPVVAAPIITAPIVAPVEHTKKGFHLPKFHRNHKDKKMVETTTTTVTTTDRPGLVVSNELLYADGASGHNTVLDGADPFNRDFLLADNPITHNEFARQPRDHHGDLKTAGPYLTAEPSLKGAHSRLVTPLGDGGDHYIDPKMANQYAKTTYDPSAPTMPTQRI